MNQTYQFWRVDRDTWVDVERIQTITAATIVRDDSEEVLQHATMECTEQLGEQFVRVYIVNDGVRDCLGTFLVQTPSFSYDGRARNVTADCYSPLLELSDTLPPYGYYAPKGGNIASLLYSMVTDNSHAPMVYAKSDQTLTDDFIADPSESWLSFIKALAARKNSAVSLDPLSRVILTPIRDAQSMTPVYTFTDDNSSILFPDISDDNDLYGIPNVVEVIYSNKDGAIVGRAVNDNPNSPVSTISRGREVTYRDTAPDIDEPTQEAVDAYALKTLREKSVRQHEVAFSSGYCRVKVGDCVLLDYRRAGLRTKAVISSQSIECETACRIDMTATYQESML